MAVLLAPLGGAAPWLWVLIVRVSAVTALLLAYRLATELAGGRRTAGVLAAAGVALSGAFLAQAASGQSEPMLIAFALAGAWLARRGHVAVVAACAVACALIRVETWPFLVVLAAWAWRIRPELRGVLLAITALVPLAWFGPELLGSGDVMRSGERARIPNPGQPALAPVPALASLTGGLAVTPWPLWLGVAALVAGAPRALAPSRRALIPAGIGVAWLLLVAAMAQVGFSGEARYALPGAALIAVSGAVGLVALARRVIASRAVVAGATGLLIAGLVASHPTLSGIPAAQGHQWRLSDDLAEVIARAGGPDALLACGTPYVGRFRGPLVAYHLDVAKRVVAPEVPPQRPGVVLRSRNTREAAAVPASPAGFVPVAANSSWSVDAACRDTSAESPPLRVP